jgi:hypothetical protein
VVDHGIEIGAGPVEQVGDGCVRVLFDFHDREISELVLAGVGVLRLRAIGSCPTMDA